MAREGQRLGVVDLGSNTTTLAIYSVGPDGFVDRVFQHGEALRLMRQLGPDRLLHAPAVEKISSLLKGFQKQAKIHGVDSLTVVATSAVRDARNGPDLLARLGEEGSKVRILSAEEEGVAAVTAVVNTLPVEHGFLFDLGGGSVQIALFEDRRVRRVCSLPLGALRLSDQFLKDDPPSGPQITALRRHVDAALQEIDWFRAKPGLELIGVGGTARSLGKLDRRNRQWPVGHGHGYPLSLDAIEATFEETSRLKLQDRLELPGLAEHRVDVIVAGALIVQRIMRRSGFDVCHLCHYGIREGTALQIVHGVEEPLIADVRKAGLNGRFPEDDPKGSAAGQQVGALYDAMMADLQRDDLRRSGAPTSPPAEDPPRWLVVAAARLAATGGRIPDEIHAPSLCSTPLPGFFQEEILLLLDLLSPAVGPPLRMNWDMRDRLRLLLEVGLEPGVQGGRRTPRGLEVSGRVPGGLRRRFFAAFGLELIGDG